MLPSSISTPLTMGFSLFVVSPLLILFAFPLLILGFITVFSSFAALFLRASLVYIELSVALARSYLLAAPEPSSSFNLKVSGEAPSSPSRSYARGLRRSHQYCPPQGVRTISPTRRGKVWRRRSAGCVEGNLGAVKRPHQHRASLPIPTGLRALTSGDQNRDFEGIGGWRSGSPLKPGFQTRSYPTTPGDEADDRTWLSFNRRLKLPSSSSPYVTRGTVTATSHGLGISTAGGAEEDAEGGREGRIWFPTSSLSSPGVRRKRHHRRSATTSSIPHSNKGQSSDNPHPLQQHQNAGHVSWQTQRGSPVIAFLNRAPENLPSEGYFSLARGADGLYRAPSASEIANIGKSMNRPHRRSLSTRTPSK